MKNTVCAGRCEFNYISIVAIISLYCNMTSAVKAVTGVSFLVRQGVWGPPSSPVDPGLSPGRSPKQGKAPALFEIVKTVFWI
jgi:hypothetical protein